MPRCHTAALLALALGACATSTWYSIHYAPSIVEVPLSADSVPGSQVRALATVLGVARAGDGRPDRVHVSLRIENLGTVEARVPADGFGLVGGDLAAFEPARLRGEAPTVPPGQSALVEVWFPLPAGRNVDLVAWNGLNLRFAVEFQGTRVTTGATFTRLDWPYWYDAPHVHMGVGFAAACD